MTRATYLFISLLCPAVAFAGWFGASNYDECVLESMKGVTSDVAARAIMRSCRDKFQEKGPSDSEVSTSVVNKLDGRASMINYGYFGGNLYNGNKEWTITQITVILTPINKGKTTTNGPRTREYNVNVMVPPLTNSNFSFAADSTGSSEFDWSISKARGYKSR